MHGTKNTFANRWRFLMWPWLAGLALTTCLAGYERAQLSAAVSDGKENVTVPALDRRPAEYGYQPTGDGCILVYRISGDGTLNLLPHLTQKIAPDAITMQVYGGKYICAARQANLDQDGYTLDTRPDNPNQNAQTAVQVFRIEPGGALRRIQTVTLPFYFGEFIAHPQGKLLWGTTPDSLLVLKAAPDGRLEPGNTLGNVPTFSLLQAHTTANHRYAVSPDGRSFWSSHQTVAMDWGRNTMSRFVVAPDGALRDEVPGAYSYENSGEEGHSPQADIGYVTVYNSRLMFVTAYRGDTGRTYICRLGPKGEMPRSAPVLPGLGAGRAKNRWAAVAACNPSRRAVYGVTADKSRCLSCRVLPTRQVQSVRTWGRGGRLHVSGSGR